MLKCSCCLLITHMYHTFFVLLKNWGRGCSHLHSQTVGPPEGVAVPHNKAAWLLVFQDWNSWRERNNDWSSSRIFLTKKSVYIWHLPWSLEMSGLYQNFDVSCTNFTVTCLLASTSGKYTDKENNKNHSTSRMTPTRLSVSLADPSLPGRGEAVPGVWADKSGKMLGKGILRELPLWGLENPLRAGEAVPSECSPSDVLFFSGRSGGCISANWFCPSIEGKRSLSRFGQSAP